MPALSRTDLARLARVLGLLASDHLGERAAAGLAANRIVKAAGLSWEDLLFLQPATAGSFPRSPTPEPEGCFDDLWICLRNLRQLSAWEQNFCLTMSACKRRSPAQVNKLREIVAQLRKRGAG